jgi:hypothetical protein
VDGDRGSAAAQIRARLSPFDYFRAHDLVMGMPLRAPISP